MRRSSWFALLAVALIGSAACDDDEGGHEDPMMMPDDQEDAGEPMPPDGEVDAGEPDGSTPMEEPDAGPLDERCITACRHLGDLIDEMMCRSATSTSASASAFGMRLEPTQKALAFELASSEPRLTRELSALTGSPSLYAPAAGVVLIDTPSAAGVLRLRQSVNVVRELPVLSDAHGRKLVVPGRVVVRIHPSVRIGQVLAKVGARLVRRVDRQPNTYLAELDEPMAAFAAAEQLSAQPGVAYAEPSLLRTYGKRQVDDPLAPQQWHLLDAPESGAIAGTHIQAAAAWQVSEGSPSSVIGIFDDGVDFEHPDLAGGIVEGVNMPANLQAEIDEGCCWHGSAVAGVAAAQANSIGLRGVCPSCSLMPIFEPSASGGMMMSEDAIAAEMFTSACDKSAVVNNSWGPPDGDPTIFEEEGQEVETLPQVVNDALAYCETSGRGGKGTVIVFAAGNGNEDVASDPFASHPLTVGVTAIDDSGRKSYYSDFGDAVDVAAPSDGGSNGIWTTALRGSGNQGDENDYMDQFGGTSSAAPVVAGLVGLILSVNPELTAAQVRDILRSTADKVDRLNAHYDEQGFSRRYGHGRVNAYRAVRAAEKLASTCKSFEAESCNGVDDDCDDLVDEDCAKAAVCEPCAFDAACASGLCAQTDNDTEPRCLEACSEGTCGDGFSCEEGLCVPTDTRCAAPANEVCNRVDDNLDGRVDEGCPPDAGCFVDAACGEGEVCLGFECVPSCETSADCEEDVECVLRTDRYGEPDGKRGCVRPFSPCRDWICNDDDSATLESFVSCIESEPDSCDEAFGCLSIVWN
jgi:subtilisin family serine protease